MAKSVGLRLGEPLDFSHGTNYFPLTVSDHQCKEELQFNACKLEGASLEVFLGNGSCSWWVSHK